MTCILRFVVPLALFSSVSARGDDVVILPASAALEGPRASQRFLVEARRGSAMVADLTARATFSIDKANVARVSPDGRVSPVGDGEAVLTARVGDQTATAAVTVKNFRKDEPWSFRNHVMPVLTRAGCNSGACHGAAAGKNGLRLTLRGYGPEVDYDVLTRQALGRRINKTSPAESLFLLKPTGAAGTWRQRAASRPTLLEYRVLAEWIKAADASATRRRSHGRENHGLPQRRSSEAWRQARRDRTGDLFQRPRAPT